MISRRRWLLGVGAAVGSVAVARRASPQAAQRPVSRPLADTSNLFAMDQGAARTVRLPPKPNAAPAMTPAERDELEHGLRCQCGCTLDIYTCRTTDFSCRVSPQMHRDVVALVQGGYTRQEILDAFVDTYGERVLMAPPRTGFNLLAYVMPGFGIAVGAIVLAIVLWRWRMPAPPARAAAPVAAPDATPEEVAELEAAVRDDS